MKWLNMKYIQHLSSIFMFANKMQHSSLDKWHKFKKIFWIVKWFKIESKIKFVNVSDPKLKIAIFKGFGPASIWSYSLALSDRCYVLEHWHFKFSNTYVLPMMTNINDLTISSIYFIQPKIILLLLNFGRSRH